MLIKSNGKALRRPVLSPDGKTLAVIAGDDRIHLIDLLEAAQGRKSINGLKITKSTRAFLRTCTILRWSPESLYTPDNEAVEVLSNTTSECEFGKSWLLVSNGRRVIAFSTDLRTPKMMPKVDEETGLKSNILADYDLGDHNGKLNLVEFVFDHRHALVLFELGSSGAVLSLNRPQRHDIPHVKFPDARSVARSPDSRYFALLRREKGQDRATVFELGDNSQVSFKSFECNTSDAQGLSWCPTGQPLLAVWDSPTYGVRVSFFTAQGHPLKQLDITSSAFVWNAGFSSQMDGVGLTYWNWRRANPNNDTLTLEVLARGQNQGLVRYQPTDGMGARVHAQLIHPNLIDGSKTFAWLESNRSKMDKPTDFARQTGSFAISDKATVAASTAQAQSKPNGSFDAQESNRIDMIELNSTHTVVATRTRSAPRALFLWRTGNTSYPHTVLIFRHAIRQINFHPSLPHVLIILTNTKNPRIYAWYQPTTPPIAGLIPIDTSNSTSFAGCWLPQCVDKGGSEQLNGVGNTASERLPFLFTSNTAFEAGYLSSSEGEIVFESILHRSSQSVGDLTMALMADDSTTEVIDTPSRPGRQKTGDSDGVVKRARFDVPEDPVTDWAHESIHEQVGKAYAYAW